MVSLHWPIPVLHPVTINTLLDKSISENFTPIKFLATSTYTMNIWRANKRSSAILKLHQFICIRSDYTRWFSPKNLTCRLHSCELWQRQKKNRIVDRMTVLEMKADSLGLVISYVFRRNSESDMWYVKLAKGSTTNTTHCTTEEIILMIIFPLGRM
jgi:hypothetical protein